MNTYTSELWGMIPLFTFFMEWHSPFLPVIDHFPVMEYFLWITFMFHRDALVDSLASNSPSWYTNCEGTTVVVVKSKVMCRCHSSLSFRKINISVKVYGRYTCITAVCLIVCIQISVHPCRRRGDVCLPC